VTTAKTAKYLQSLLADPGFTQISPTILYEDNQAVIHMINLGKPMAPSHHINVQHFAIQEWHANGDIHMRYIPTSIQLAKVMTKACGSVLHHCHIHHIMGHFHLD